MLVYNFPPLKIQSTLIHFCTLFCNLTANIYKHNTIFFSLIMISKNIHFIAQRETQNTQILLELNIDSFSFIFCTIIYDSVIYASWFFILYVLLKQFFMSTQSAKHNSNSTIRHCGMS